MKVLHLIGGGDVGGAKIHVLTLVKELKKHIDVKIVALRPGEFADDARKMGIGIEVVKSGSIAADILKVIRMVREDKYTIVHSHGAKANMFSFFIRRTTGIPTVTTVHSDYRLDYMHSVVKRYTFGLINTAALRFVDYYVTVSRRFRDMLIERRFNFENIYTVYNGMDFSIPVPSYNRRTFLEKFGVLAQDHNILVGILARLVPVKGVDTFIDAAAKAAQCNPDLIFLVGGDGAERRMLEKKARRLGLSDRLFFLGWIDDSYEFLSCIDINVLSSLSETFPYSILEGVRVRRPTISTDVGGIPDLIENGINGLLFNTGDSQALARHILYLASDPERRNIMADKLFKKARSQFSLSSMSSTQLQIYKSIVFRWNKQGRKPEYYDAILSGYYGFKNLGDDAMLQAIIGSLKNYKDNLRLTVLSSDPVEVKKNYGMNSISRVSIYRIIRTMKKSKLFIYGGGTLIQESTSTRSLFYYLFMIWIAQKMGLNVMLYANGIEPIKKYINRKITQKIMNRINLITLREADSLKELERLGISNPRIEVTADPALNILPSEQNTVDDILKREGIPFSSIYIGFSARKWDGFHKGEERRAVVTLAAAADHVSKKYGAVPVFIPMQPGDRIILEEIISNMKCSGFLIKGQYGAKAIMGITGRMEIVIGMRLHSIVFAAAMGVPVVGLVYEPKVDSFLRYIQQGDASAGSVKQLDTQKLMHLIQKVWVNRKHISSDLLAVTEKLKEKALYNARLAAELMEDK